MPAPPPTPNEDTVLLAAFQAGQSPEAFRELVEQHLPLVWSVARRVLVSCPALVEDAAQIVFADLARRAPKLRTDAPLGGWLHQHTWFTASKLLRSELRRSTREATAAAMNAADSPLSENDSSAIWSQLAPELDAALAGLNSSDREAVVQRFFEGKNFHQVGCALGVGEEAARKRVTRAVEKLRVRLRRRGAAAPTAAVLAAALAAGQAVAAPPSALAASVSSGAWARRGAGSASAAGGLAHWFALARHSPWAAPVAGVSVIAVGLAVWWVAAFAVRPDPSAHAAATPHAPPSLLPPGDPLRVEIVIFNIEEAFARRGLRQREVDGDDAAFFEQLDASAAPPPDLRRLIPPGTQPVLSQVVKAAALEGACRSGRVTKLRDAYEFEYYTEFSVAVDKARIFPAHTERRYVGTTMEIEAGARGLDGSRPVRLKYDHFFAPPAMRKWPVQVREDGGVSDLGPEQPDFQIAAGTSQVAASPGKCVLACSLLLPPPLEVSDPPAAPRRLLIFLRLHEDISQTR